MRDEYAIEAPKSKLEVEIEKTVVETLQQMSNHSKLTVNELVNTALKRFIAGHKDFLPRGSS